MSQPIVYIDTSEIRGRKLEELKMAVSDLADFVEANVPQLLSYGFFLNEDQSRITVAAIHPDSASIEHHMDVCGDEFRKFADLIKLVKIDVYGHVSDSVLERLHQKARMLGDGTVTVHGLCAGFAR